MQLNIIILNQKKSNIFVDSNNDFYDKKQSFNNIIPISLH